MQHPQLRENALSLLPPVAVSHVSRMGVAVLAVFCGIGLGAVSLAAPSMLAICLAVAVVIGVCLRSRIHALMLLVIALPLVEAFGGTVSELGLSASSWWAVGVTLVAAIALTEKSQARSLSLSPRILPVFGLIAAYLVAVVVERAFGGILYAAGLFSLLSWTLLCLAITASCDSRERQLTVVRCADAAAVVLSVAVFVLVLRNQYGALYYSADAWKSWNPDTMTFPHEYALFAVLLIPIVLAQVHARYHPTLATVLSALLSLVVLLSYVRSAYLALFLMWAVFLAQAFSNTALLRVRLTAAVITTSGAIALYMSRFELLHRVNDLLLIGLSGDAANRAGSGRLGFWKELARRATDTNAHLLLGQGLGASRRILFQVMGLGIWAHNDFLEFLVAGGVLMLAIFCTLVGWMIWSTRPLAVDSRQSLPSRRFGVLAVAGTCSWILVAFTNGATFYHASVAVGVLVGLCRAMRVTPGATWMDSDKLRSALPRA